MNEVGQRPFFQCLPCNYITFRKNDYDKHLTTNKHRKLILNNDNVEKKCFYCSKCSKQYKHLKSLTRHQKTCNFTKPDEIDASINTIEEINNTLIQSLEETVKNNKILYDKISELEANPKTVNNTMTVNNEFNINLFLNTQYKSAINLDDFKNQLKLTLEDLLYTKNNGFAKGIANIFIRNLEELGPNKRPIHYSDIKNQGFFIKNDNNWIEDDGHNNINSVINNVAQAQISKIKDWERQNPNWNDTETGKAEYFDIIKSAITGKNPSEEEKNLDYIKQTLKDNVEIVVED